MFPTCNSTRRNPDVPLHAGQPDRACGWSGTRLSTDRYPYPGRDHGTSKIRAAAEWVNFYDPDDIVAYPLRTLNDEYKHAVDRDPGPSASDRRYWVAPPISQRRFTSIHEESSGRSQNASLCSRERRSRGSKKPHP